MLKVLLIYTFVFSTTLPAVLSAKLKTIHDELIHSEKCIPHAPRVNCSFL